MTDPVRWRDDPRAPAAVRELLAGAPPITPLPDHLRPLDALRLPVSPPASGVRGLLRSMQRHLQRSFQRPAPGISAAGAGSTATVTAFKALVMLVAAVTAAAGVTSAVIARFSSSGLQQGSSAGPSELRRSDSSSTRPKFEMPANSSEAVVPSSTESVVSPPVEAGGVHPSEERALPRARPEGPDPRASRSPVVAHRSSARVQGAAPSAPSPDVSADPLLAEARSLKAIRQLSDPGQQLRALQLHARQFPSGALLSERRVLEIQAHLALGQAAEAQRVARELRVRDPAAFRAYGVDRLPLSAPANEGGGTAPQSPAAPLPASAQ